MTSNKWTYMLRILQRNPDRIRMDRLGEYIRLFADLLGPENEPRFSGIKKASTGLKATIPFDREQEVRVRLLQAKSQTGSRPARILEKIEELLGEDGIANAQLLDSSERIVYLFQGTRGVTLDSPQIYQEGAVDGTVIGLVGADETMHLQLRDHLRRTIRLVVRNEELARQILLHFRSGTIRAHVKGFWRRTEDGWIPEPGKCSVEGFDVLASDPISQVLQGVRLMEGNGWKILRDPVKEWEMIRGLH